MLKIKNLMLELYMAEKSIRKSIRRRPCEDAVSRQAVLDKAYAYGNGLEPEGYCVEVEDIQALPSVVPTRKKGSDTE